MSKVALFKPLPLVVAVMSIFTVSTQAWGAAWVKQVSVDGSSKEDIKDSTELIVGTDDSVVIASPSRVAGGNPAFVNNGSHLTIKGKEIILDGGWSETGLDIYDYNNKSGSATIGTSTTQNITISAQEQAIINTAGYLNLDAQNIYLSATESDKNTGVLELKGKEGIGKSNNTIGQSAKNIIIEGRQKAQSNAYDSYGVRLLNGATLTLGNNEADLVKIDSKVKGTAYGVYAESSATEANNLTILGKKIDINAQGEKVGTGVLINLHSNATIGQAGVSDITINSKNTISDGENSYSYGVWVSSIANAQKPAGNLKLEGNVINVYAEGTNDTRAIFVASNDLNPKSRASVKLIGEEISIEAKSTDENNRSMGIVAMSAGDVEVVGNTTLTADDAILVRGNSKVAINSDGKHTTVINGDIVFDYDKPTSNTPVDATVDVVLNGVGSSWKGNTVVSWNGDHTDSDTKLDVTGMKLTLSNNAVWTPTVTANDETTKDQGSKYVALNNLKLDGGVVNVTGDDIDVTVENMTGTGTVNLATDGTTAGKFNVEDADKNASLSVNLMDTKLEKQLTADEINADQAKKLMANVGGKDADGKNVVATSTAVPEGMVNPAFGIDAAGKTHEASANTLMQSSLELASAAPLALNRIMMNDVRKRLGDIRTTEGTHGAWARYDGGKLSGEGGLENDFHTVQVGIDTVPTADSARMGVAFSYTDSDAEYARGKADMKAYSIAMYGTKVFDNGMFVDVIGRMGTADSDLTVDGQHKGTLDNVVLGVSGEFGWRFDVTNSMYIEPQAELSYAYVNGDKLTLGTAEYEVDSVNSLLGRVGFAAGLKCPSDMGNVYVRASAVHEFLGDSKITGANAGHTNVYEIDGKDTWVEYGLGANFNVTKSTYVWADVERTSGGALDEDWRATVGVRYAW